ncbi:sulfatase family protein [Thalassotalea crassostreae]|uniref:sulfatase family protein n=1 Tax=Thalassotalea crassostreae TaxID=1763536 RepID=UPI000838143F|nr:arylsulfatase [Thalassotalea crassostreae]
MISRLLLLLCFYVISFNSAAKQQPNVVFILADDMGVGDVSLFNKDAKVNTTNLDKIASNGMYFSDAHSTSAVCTPTRYSLLTGRYHWRTEMKGRVIDGYGKALIKPNRATVARLLQDNNYKTAMFGKWHLGLNWQLTNGKKITEYRPKDIEPFIDFSKPFTGGPVEHGFDYFYGINASLDFPPYTWIENNKVIETPTILMPYKGPKKSDKTIPWLHRKGLRSSGFDAALVMQHMTEKTVDYIAKQDSKQPFFIYMPLTAPHTPVIPRKEFLGSSNAGIYGDFVHEVDWAVGEVYQALKKQGLLENTIIVFTADNGAAKVAFSLADQEKYQHKPSYIYKGSKASVDEGGHRVPFIVHWPEKIAATGQSSSLIELTDTYATLADLLGVNLAENAAEDSISFLPQLLDVGHKGNRSQAVHTGFSGHFAFRSGDWKLKLSKNTKQQELYNLANDIAETNNVIAKNPEVAKRLQDEFSKIILDGRLTPGKPQKNDGEQRWSQAYWLK